MLARIQKNQLQIRNNTPLIQGTVGATLQAAFSEDWEPLSIVAVFSSGSTRRDVVVGENEIVIPWELFSEADHDLFLNFHGSDEAGQIVLRSNIVSLGRILPSNAPSGQEPDAPSPSRADQIQALAEQAVRTAQSVRDDADNGVFDGEKGEPGEVSQEQFDALSGRFIELQQAFNAEQSARLTMFPCDSASGNIASFPDGAGSVPVKSLVLTITPLQSGSGIPSADHVRSITGWTGAQLFKTGKNLFGIPGVIDGNGAVSETAYNLSHGRRSELFPVNAGDKIMLRKSAVFAENWSNLLVARYDKNRVFISRSNALAYNAYLAPYTVPNGTAYIAFSISLNKPEDFETADIQVEFGQSPTDYEPYSSNTLICSWQSAAGTVYGGTLDVSTGKLTVTHENIASYAGETLPGSWLSSMDVYAEGATPTIGAQVVYQLASPVVYQLTPQEVTTLLGQNHIWADTGNVSVLYRADIQRYLQKCIGSAET